MYLNMGMCIIHIFRYREVSEYREVSDCFQIQGYAARLSMRESPNNIKTRKENQEKNRKTKEKKKKKPAGRGGVYRVSDLKNIAARVVSVLALKIVFFVVWGSNF